MLNIPHNIIAIMGIVKVFGREPVSEDLTPLQKGLKKAVSLNYYNLGSIEERSVDRMRAIGLLKVGIDGTISPTKMGKGMMDGSIKTNNEIPPFVAGLVRWGGPVTIP